MKKIDTRERGPCLAHSIFLQQSYETLFDSPLKKQPIKNVIKNTPCGAEKIKTKSEEEKNIR